MGDGPNDAFGVVREYDGFTNPHVLQSRAVTGAGAGWQIITPQKPPPVARV